MKKRGILLTLGLTILAMVVLALALLMFRHTQKSGETLAALTVLERTKSIDFSAQNNLKEIFNSKSGIKVSREGLTVTFEENLSNANKETFNAAVKDFKAYAELNNPNVMLNVTEIAQDLPLKITPHNITYTHKEFFGGNQIVVIPESLNLNEYSITITIKENVTSCIQDLKEEGGMLNFKLHTNTPEGSCDVTAVINLEESSLITINGKIIVSIENNQLSIINSYDYPIKVKTSITLSGMQKGPSITYPGKVIRVNFSEFGIMKESSPNLL